MKRIGILTAGGDTPALNATIHGAVVRANQLRESRSSASSRASTACSIRACRTFISTRSSRKFPSSIRPRAARSSVRRAITSIRTNTATLDRGRRIASNARHRRADLHRRRRHAQRAAAARRAPADRARAQDDRQRSRPELPERTGRMGPRERRGGQTAATATSARESRAVFDLDQIVNYVTPGYATAVFVSAQGVERIRTTAESHRRIAIIEVMGRHSGYIALGTAYGQPDIILVPEHAARSRTPRRARETHLRPAEERRHRLRRRHRGRAGPRTRRGNEDPPTRRATSC